MAAAGAETVADLAPAQAAEFARKVWATPPDLL
jgi:hypothetical protein